MSYYTQKKNRKCKKCGKKLNQYQKDACSWECRNLIKNENRKCLECGNEFCVKKSSGKKLCSLRCAVLSRSGSKSKRWKGGRSISKKRYVRINLGKGIRMFEHRLVGEKMLGRKLKSTEAIHHIDGDKLNNKESNLYICSSNADHQRAHRSMEPVIFDLVNRGLVIFEKGKYKLSRPIP